MSLADKAAGYFESTGHTWNFEDERRIPTADDIQFVIDEAKRLLPNGGQMEMGRLIIMINEDGVVDLYTHLGEENGV